MAVIIAVIFVLMVLPSEVFEPVPALKPTPGYMYLIDSQFRNRNTT